jgi:hypothetical protein
VEALRGETVIVDASAESGDRARRERHETPLEQLDRNWKDLLQELRVTQTGVQLLTGFLLTLPFQSRFPVLTDVQRTIYLVTVSTSVVATVFLIGPVSLHRLLFRRHARRETVQIGHRLALVGIALLGVAMVGVMLLIFAVVLGDKAGLIAAAVIAALLVIIWGLLPLRVRSAHSDPSDGKQ